MGIMLPGLLPAQTADTSVVAITVTAYRVNLVTAHEADSVVHGRVPSLYLEGRGRGPVAGQDRYNVTVLFVPSESERPAPRLDLRTGSSRIFFDIHAYEAVLGLLRAPGRVEYQLVSFAGGYYAKLTGPQIRRR
jgi:hypothetical protein